MHLKLDELIRGVTGARTNLVDLEDLSDKELDQLQKEFERMRGSPRAPAKAKKSLEQADETVEEELAQREKEG